MGNKLTQFILDTPQKGKVEFLSYRKEHKGAVITADKVNILEESGIEGDHYGKKGKRMVTIIQKEHLEAIAKILKKDNIDPKLTRRNIVVSGFNLKSLIGHKFRLGKSAVLLATGDCVPCNRMEENFGPGGYHALVGHGGITCQVIEAGSVELGDELSILKEAE
jgi:MOSC domain-containing protein YiiM